ncbi:bZIP transcription factor ABI5 homolog [Wolffia australiana]
MAASTAENKAAEQRDDAAAWEGTNQPHNQHAMARQSSLLSLTLDEIQSTVCEPGKTFGSMNMDEFLSNIWTAEETAAAQPPPPPLQRQGSSVSLPPSLCRKTVDEVWSEIQRDQGQPPHHPLQPPPPPSSVPGVPRQRTLGEMTLEDFLIKAGVVRDAAAVPFSVAAPAEQMHGQAAFNGFYGGMHNQRLGSPASPASSDGTRKRGADGGPDRVLERRQRRMIKNRESAARSRARKQAYTVELETELNQLKEENARLQEEQRRLAARRRQQLAQEAAERAALLTHRRKPSNHLRHCSSCIW